MIGLSSSQLGQIGARPFHNTYVGIWPPPKNRQRHSLDHQQLSRTFPDGLKIWQASAM